MDNGEVELKLAWQLNEDSCRAFLNLVEKIKALVADVDFDLDEPLPPENH